MSLFYKISIDQVNTNYLSGWCFQRLRRNDSVVLQCWHNDQLIAETQANLFREDLRELRIHPTGRCGFEFLFELGSEFVSSEKLTIKPKNVNQKLLEVWPGTGEITFYQDYFARLKDSFKKKKGALTIVFMHIPKTAGTTFNTAAQTFFPSGSVISHIELIDKNRYEALPSSYHFISGHLRFGLLKSFFLAENTDFYTIVREPYAQLHSHLNWLINTAADSSDNYFKHNNPAIYILGKRLASVDLSNASLISEFVENLSHVEAAFLENLQTRYFLDNQPENITDMELALAKENSQLFKLIGFTEEYDSFVDTFVQWNRLSFIRQTGELNKSSRSKLFDFSDPDIRRALFPLVWADLDLYEYLRKSNYP